MNRKFWLFLLALLVLMLALEYQMPRRFLWEPTFAHADRQPFGSYVFDSIFSQEMPHGYTVCRKSLSQLALQDTTPRSIVILCSGYQQERVDVDTLLVRVKNQSYHCFGLLDCYFYSSLLTLHSSLPQRDNGIVRKALRLSRTKRQ